MLQPPITGKALQYCVDSPQEKREFIAEGFLKEKTCLIVSADGGTGKSTISLQAALQLTCGVSLFGAFEVKRPHKVYYIQKERTASEIYERIEMMQKFIPWIADNFILDSKLQEFNLARETNWRMILDRILPYKADIIFIDPIYAGTPGLSKDEVASAFTTFLTMLEFETQASVWLNHHNVKDTYDRDGIKVSKDDNMYGSVWIRNHVSAAYQLSKTLDGTKLIKKKDNDRDLIENLELEFNIETYISIAKGEWGSNKDKIMRFITSMRNLEKTFTMDEIIAQTGVSRSLIFDYFRTPNFKKILKNVSPSGIKGLYAVSDF